MVRVAAAGKRITCIRILVQVVRVLGAVLVLVTQA